MQDTLSTAADLLTIVDVLLTAALEATRTRRRRENNDEDDDK
ncbi:hypothetical protein ACIBBB_29685 [Streptomyces sp. NPDC051217]